MTEPEAIEIAGRHVRQLVNEGTISPCEFRCARLISKSNRDGCMSRYWVLDFPFTEEDATGLALHVRIDDSTGDVSLIESL